MTLRRIPFSGREGGREGGRGLRTLQPLLELGDPGGTAGEKEEGNFFFYHTLCGEGRREAGREGGGRGELMV